MSTGSRVRIIGTQLGYVAQSIRDESLKLTAKGTTPNIDSQAYTDFQRKLSGWSVRLQRLQKQIKSMIHTQEGRASRIYSVPREFRYSENQSISDQLSSLEGIEKYAQDVARACEVLWQKGLTPTSIDLINRSAKAIVKNVDFIKEINDIERELSKTQFTGQQAQELKTAITEVRAQIKAAEPYAAPMTVDYLAMLIFLVRLMQIVGLAATTRKR